VKLDNLLVALIGWLSSRNGRSRSKEETLNVPIQRLIVNGRDFPYRIEERLLKLDLVTPHDGPPVEVAIRWPQ